VDAQIVEDGGKDDGVGEGKRTCSTASTPLRDR
jgi:hypothetical protein